MAQAAFQVRLFDALPFIWILPSTACNCSLGTPRLGATASSSLSSALTVDLRVEEETPPMVVEPPEPFEKGRELSPITTFTASSGRPKVSAATMLMAVRVPVPRSWLPNSTSTEPSGLMVVRHWLACPPPCQVDIATPTPRLMGPEPESPRGCHFFFQSIISEAF